MKRSTFAELGVGLMLAAQVMGCSSSSDGGAKAQETTGNDGGGKSNNTPDGSPAPTPDAGGSTTVDSGGTVSKNGADGCPVNSGFVGDERCTPAPADGEGFQLHFGPSDYDDPDDVNRFVLQPGTEIDKCFFVKMPNSTDVDYSRIHGKMRPGSHHFIARAMEDRVGQEGFQDCSGADATGQTDSIGGSQFGEFEFPSNAPENADLIGTLYANRAGMLNGHFINSTEEPTLAEAWINYDLAKPDVAGKRVMGMSLNGGVGMRIEPHTKSTLHYSCSPDQDLRVVALSGHFHAHTVRYSAWKVDSAGKKTLVMEAFNWEELAAYNFDSVTQNAPSDRVASKDGAISGELTVAKGESLEWECEINNDSDGILKFRNEVFTGEMCMSVGYVVAVDGETKPWVCTRN